MILGRAALGRGICLAGLSVCLFVCLFVVFGPKIQLHMIQSEMSVLHNILSRTKKSLGLLANNYIPKVHVITWKIVHQASQHV